MTIQDKVIGLIEDIMKELDTIPKPEDKRKLIAWVSNGWNGSIRELALYTNVVPEDRHKAVAAIKGRLEMLRKPMEF